MRKESASLERNKQMNESLQVKDNPESSDSKAEADSKADSKTDTTEKNYALPQEVKGPSTLSTAPHS